MSVSFSFQSTPLWTALSDQARRGRRSLDFCFNPPLCGLPFRTSEEELLAEWPVRVSIHPSVDCPFGRDSVIVMGVRGMFQSTPLWIALSDGYTGKVLILGRVSIHPSVDCPFGQVPAVLARRHRQVSIHPSVDCPFGQHISIRHTERSRVSIHPSVDCPFGLEKAHPDVYNVLFQSTPLWTALSDPKRRLLGDAEGGSGFQSTPLWTALSDGRRALASSPASSFNPPLCGLPFRTWTRSGLFAFNLSFQSTPLWTALSDGSSTRGLRRYSGFNPPLCGLPFRTPEERRAHVPENHVSIHPSVDCPFGRDPISEALHPSSVVSIHPSVDCPFGPEEGGGVQFLHRFNPPLCGLPFRTVVFSQQIKSHSSFNPPLCGLPFRTRHLVALGISYTRFNPPLCGLPFRTRRLLGSPAVIQVSIHPSVDCPFGL